MNGQGFNLHKPAVLYDSGGWFVFFIFYGPLAVVGLVLDYFWNFLMLSLGTRLVRESVESLRKHIFCLIVTPIGLLIDWIYWQLIKYGGYLNPSQEFYYSELSPAIKVVTILMPMAVLMLEYFLLLRVFMHLTSKQAALVGVFMGLFTSPWLILAYSLLRG